MTTTQAYIINKFNEFAQAHKQIERFEFDYEDQLNSFSTEDTPFPIMFCSPIDNDYRQDVSLSYYGFRISVYDIEQKDRTNVKNLTNATELIIQDFIRYYNIDNNDAPFYIDPERNPSSFPVSDLLVDYCQGHYVDVYIQADSYSVCDIPMDDLPPTPKDCPDAVVENSDGSFSVNIVSGGEYTLEDNTFNILNYTGGTISGVTYAAQTDQTINLSSFIDNNIYLYFNYESGDNVVGPITGNINNTGTINVVNSGLLTGVDVQVNSVSVTTPFTFSIGDLLEIFFNIPASDGEIILEGEY